MTEQGAALTTDKKGKSTTSQQASSPNNPFGYSQPPSNNTQEGRRPSEYELSEREIRHIKPSGGAFCDWPFDLDRDDIMFTVRNTTSMEHDNSAPHPSQPGLADTHRRSKTQFKEISREGQSDSEEAIDLDTPSRPRRRSSTQATDIGQGDATSPMQQHTAPPAQQETRPFKGYLVRSQEKHSSQTPEISPSAFDFEPREPPSTPREKTKDEKAKDEGQKAGAKMWQKPEPRSNSPRLWESRDQ
ncbi:hypothetical protein CSOJ01_14494 [Colletotrichum sojae]|uniref:Uncharacterized protein n=1 Tax=Colletotrichum sojae TaxID=2175907 RepID=A0A8H6MJ94_9PEZI|nr:hypothetical protein CSOJ01_14494 [Colletotrichum sojae]